MEVVLRGGGGIPLRTLHPTVLEDRSHCDTLGGVKMQHATNQLLTLWNDHTCIYIYIYIKGQTGKRSTKSLVHIQKKSVKGRKLNGTILLIQHIIACQILFYYLSSLCFNLPGQILLNILWTIKVFSYMALSLKTGGQNMIGQFHLQLSHMHKFTAHA